MFRPRIFGLDTCLFTQRTETNSPIWRPAVLSFIVMGKEKDNGHVHVRTITQSQNASEQPIKLGNVLKTCAFCRNVHTF